MVTEGPLDDLSASVLHVDVDAFFVSVELLERPELRGRPVLVGGTGPRAVVAAASYEARRFGVNSAMPMATALRACPNAVVLPPRSERYAAASRSVMEVLSGITPLVERLSIDEAFLDVRGARRSIGTPWQIGTLLRRRVTEATGLTVSVGAAATKFVAKLASSKAKPDGLLVVPEPTTVGFLHPLPASALWGVGARTLEKLESRGIRTVGELARTPPRALERALGPALATKLHELSWGRDPRRVTTERVEKSIGHEVTFDVDVDDIATLERELLRLSIGVARRVRSSGVRARTIAVKLRFGGFDTITRSVTLAEPVELARQIHEAARALFAEAVAGRPVRLIGVRAEQLVTADGSDPRWSDPLWDDDADWRAAERMLDTVEERFGRGSVRPASLLDAPEVRMPYDRVE